MSTNYSGLLDSVMSAGKETVAAAQDLSKTADQTQKTSQDFLTQTLQSIKDQQDVILQEGQLNQQAATQVNNAIQNDANVKAFQAGQNALAPDLADAVAQFHTEYQKYKDTSGGFVNQFMLGLTGKDIAGENLQRKAQVLNSLTTGLSTLAQNANVDTQLTTQIAAAQIAAPKAALDAKAKAANVVLDAAPAVDKTLGNVERSAQLKVASSSDKLSALKEMYMTALDGSRIARENQNADLQRQALQLEVQQRQMVVQQLTRNEDYMNSLATYSNIPRTMLDRMPESEVQKVADMSLGLPLVTNLNDIKEVQSAAKIGAYTDKNVFAKVTTQPVANAILGYQQQVAALQQSAISTGKALPALAKSQNFNLLNDINKDFLDTVPIQLPGQDKPAPLTDTLGDWFLHPVGSPGAGFWKSLEANDYANSNSPGAPIAKRILTDIQVNPALLKANGVDLNYMKSIGASPQAAFDFYNFIRQNVALSTPYQTFGMQPPKAKFKVPLSYQDVGFMGQISPAKSWQSFDTADDVEKAFVMLDAKQKAAALANELEKNAVSGTTTNLTLTPGG